MFDVSSLAANALMALETAALAVLRSSWQAGVLALLVLMICRGFPQLPARWRCWLWLIVLVRLLAPGAPQSSISMFNLAKLPLAASNSARIDPRPGAAPISKVDFSHAHRFETLGESQREQQTIEPDRVVDPQQAEDQQPTKAVSVRAIVGGIWLLGVVFMLLHGALCQVRLRRFLPGCRPAPVDWALEILAACRAELGVRRRVDLLVADGDAPPSLAGFMRPRIILSQRTLHALSAEEMRWLFRHELAHVRRADVARRHIWWWARTLHWFNPVVWWALARTQTEAELACDELVLNQTNSAGRIQYGRSLLKVAELMIHAPPLPGVLGMLQQEPELTRRIRMIANYRRRNFRIVILAWVLMIGVVCVGLTDAVRGTAPQQTKPQKSQSKQPAAAKTTVSPSRAKAQTPSKRSMRIRVIGENGKPIPQAKIHVAVWAKDPPKGNRDYVCDMQGRMTIQLPQSIRILRIWAAQEGRVPLFAQWWPKMQPDGHLIPAEYTFKLPTGTVIGGIVKNERGKPISGVKVEVMRTSPRFEDQLRKRPIVSTWLAEGDQARVTDAKGRWTLNNVPAGEEIEILVKLSHSDYINDENWGGLQREQGVTTDDLRAKTAQIVMHRGLTLTGVVSDPKGKPILGAIVIWGDDPYLQWGSQEVRTDRMGFYRLPPLPAGRLTITVVAKGWAPQMQKIELPSDRRSKVPSADFKLKKGKTLRIRFVDSQGAAIPDVFVGVDRWRGVKSLYNHKHPNVLDTQIPRTSDKNGVYQWTWAPSDEVVYSLGKPNYHHVSRALTAGREATVTLTRQMVIQGRVTDAETGKPIPSFQVIPGDGAGPRLHRPAAVNASDGQYRYVFENRDRRVYIQIEAPDYQPVKSPVYPQSERTLTFDARLEK